MLRIRSVQREDTTTAFDKDVFDAVLYGTCATSLNAALRIIPYLKTVTTQAPRLLCVKDAKLEEVKFRCLLTLKALLTTVTHNFWSLQEPVAEGPMPNLLLSLSTLDLIGSPSAMLGSLHKLDIDLNIDVTPGTSTLV